MHFIIIVTTSNVYKYSYCTYKYKFDKKVLIFRANIWSQKKIDFKTY